MATIASIMVRIGADISQFQTKLQNARKTLKSTGDKLTSIGGGLTKGITAPIVGIGTAAIKASTDFNSAMANVATLIPGNTKRVDELKESIDSMAIETGKSTEDLAGGLYQIISAFGDSADTAKILEINAKAAAAGLASTTDAINLTSAVTKGYGDTSAAAVQHVSDLAFETVKLGQTTFPQLAASIGEAVPMSKQLDVSMEELFASEATLSGVTGTTSEVTDGLRSAMQALMSPSKQMQTALKNIGFGNAQAAIKALGFKGTLDKLVGSAHGNTEELSKMFGRVQGLTQVLALTGSQSDSYNKKLKQMQNVTGATNQAFEEQTQGINKTGFSMKQLKEQVQVLLEKTGDGLAPALGSVVTAISPLIGFVTKLADGFSKLNPHVQTAIITFFAIAAAIGPMLMGFGTLISTMSTVAGALNLTLGPIFLIILAIAAFIAVVALIVAYWKPISSFFVNLWHGIQSVFMVAINAIGIFLENSWKSITTGITNAWNSVRTLTITVWNGILNFFKKWWPLLLVIFLGPVGYLVDLLVQHWTQIRTFTSTAWNAIMNFFKKWWPTLLIVFLGPLGYLIDLIVQHWSQIKNFTSSVWNAVRSFLKSVWNGIKSVASSIWNAISNLFTSIWNREKRGFENIWNAIKSFASSIWNRIKGTASSVWNAIYSAIHGPVSRVESALSGIWSRIRNTAVNAWNGLKSSASRIFHSIVNAITAPFRHIKIPLPHISFTTSTAHFAGIKVPVPIPHIKWNAAGGIYTGPSIIGVGEAGTEAAIPLSGSAMQPFAKAIADEMPDGAASDRPIVLHLYLDGKEFAVAVAPHMDSAMQVLGRSRSRASGVI